MVRCSVIWRQCLTAEIEQILLINVNINASLPQYLTISCFFISVMHYYFPNRYVYDRYTEKIEDLLKIILLLTSTRTVTKVQQILLHIVRKFSLDTGPSSAFEKSSGTGTPKAFPEWHRHEPGRAREGVSIP